MGPGDGSIPSCHGDTGCILRQARAALVQSRTGVPPASFLAAVPGEGRAGARLLAWHPGDRAVGLCQVSSEQSKASHSCSLLGVCGGPPSPKKVSPPFP